MNFAKIKIVVAGFECSLWVIKLLGNMMRDKRNCQAAVKKWCKLRQKIPARLLQNLEMGREDYTQILELNALLSKRNVLINTFKVNL